MIRMIRVDYRLLHGQVALSWTQALGANALLIVSDTIENDKLRLQTLKLAKPDNTKVVVKNTQEAIEALESGITDKYKLFIICETLSIATKIAKATNTNSIDIGNIPFAEGKKQVSKSVFLSPEDVDLVQKLASEDFDLYIQMVPNEKKIEVKKILRELK